MSRIYRAAVVGCSRMGAFIDNEFVGLPGRYAPHSHAAGYEACDRTDLVAGVDMRPDVLAQFGQRYGVAESHLYTDYREMLAKEQPDIISVATQPEQRAEIAIYAAEHGVKALYCEKAMCASLQEADAMVAAVERHGVVFNMGTNRRWHPGYAKMRDLIASGDLGNLELLLIYNNSALFNSSSHNFDLIQFLNGDEPVIWAQGWVDRGDEIIVGDEVREDPNAEGMFGFANGVTVSVIRGPRGQDYEAVCEDGIITASNQDVDFLVRRRERPGPAPAGASFLEQRRHTFGAVLEEAPALAYTPGSNTLRLVGDLVQALDTGGPTRGGVRVARANTEIIFGFIESHRRGGARVSLPLEDCRLRLIRRARAPRAPRYSSAGG